MSYNIDGLILAERTHTPRTLKMLATAGIPVVELMDSVSPCYDSAVGLDNMRAAYEMTQAMIARGCRRVIYLGARHDERTFMRLQGYEQAMRDAGLEPGNVMTQESSSYSLGRDNCTRSEPIIRMLTGCSVPTMTLLSGLFLSVSASGSASRRIWRLPGSTAMMSAV